MKILSVNAGSSSLKFTLFEMDNEEVLISGLFERIGISDGHYVIKYQGFLIILKTILSRNMTMGASTTTVLR